MELGFFNTSLGFINTMHSDIIIFSRINLVSFIIEKWAYLDAECATFVTYIALFLNNLRLSTLVKTKVPNPFVLLSEVAQAHGVSQKSNGESVPQVMCG